MSLIKKCLLLLAVSVLLVIATAARVLYPQILKPEPVANYPEPRSTGEANRQDIDFLGRLLEIDRSFSPAAREAFAAGIVDLKGRAGELTPAQLKMEAARLVALADNGHTNVKGVSHGASLNALPIRINRFAEGYFITRARPEHADLLGAHIETIHRRTPDTLVNDLAPYVGGPPSLRREFAPYMMISPQALQAIGLAEHDDRLTLAVTLPDGASLTRDITAELGPVVGELSADPAIAMLQRRHWPLRDMSPVPSRVDDGSWETVLDPDGPLPRYLRHPDERYWREEISEIDALYVQINVTRNAASGPTLPEFLQG